MLRRVRRIKAPGTFIRKLKRDDRYERGRIHLSHENVHSPNIASVVQSSIMLEHAPVNKGSNYIVCELSRLVFML